MVLMELKDDDNWIISKWSLTYKVSWRYITKAASSAFAFFDDPELLVDGNKHKLLLQEQIKGIKEKSSLSIRGTNKIIGVPMMITFYNQLNIVEVYVAKLTDEFKETNYEKFNKSLDQYLDSLELAMYK